MNYYFNMDCPCYTISSIYLANLAIRLAPVFLTAPVIRLAPVMLATPAIRLAQVMPIALYIIYRSNDWSVPKIIYYKSAPSSFKFLGYTKLFSITPFFFNNSYTSR